MAHVVMAIWRRGRPKELLHHFRSRQPVYQRGVPAADGRARVTCSLSRSGDVWDNAAMESFLSSLKVERLARKVYRTREARADVFNYSTIGYLSRSRFAQRARLA